MSTLLELQRAFADLVFGDEPSAASGTVSASEFLSVPPPAEIDDRVGVYRRGFPARVHEALLDVYPAITHILGAPTFQQLAARFASSGALDVANLNHAGEGLPAFLRDDLIAASLPFLPDLALLERAVQRAFHAYARAPIPAAILSDVASDAWPHAQLQFQPALAVIESSWPIHDLWCSRDTSRNAIDIDLVGRGQSVLVYRTGVDVHAETIESKQARTLAMLLDGSALGEAIEAAAAMGAELSSVGQWTRKWMSAGWIIGLRLSQQ